MTVSINQNLTATYSVNNSNQLWVLQGGVSIEVANGHGMVNGYNFSDTEILVLGDIAADGTFKAGILSSGSHATLTVGGNSTIHAYNGIVESGGHTTVTNYGRVVAESTGIIGSGVQLVIDNQGTIDAAQGIYVSSPEVGPIKIVKNSGIISADKGIVGAQSNLNIANAVDGQIHSKIAAVTFGGNDAEDRNWLVNAGLIDGEVTAIQGSIGRDYIENHGTIKGAIVLGDGADWFDNSGGTVDHAVNGGAGHDTYIFGTTAFTIVDSAGSDTIGTETTRTLADYPMIEDLRLMGSNNINGTGNSLANRISGNNGNNILDGGDDDVIDTLNGGDGSDTYILRDGMDIVTDGFNVPIPGWTQTGTDTIVSTTGRNLGNYQDIENLKIAGSADANGTGNYMVNVITGNAGKNILDGGAEGVDIVDTLNGGAGNDTYVLGSGHDKVIDAAGTDTITSLISRNLSTFATIENLKLLGVSNISATGNALANTLTGNSGVNTLSGAAGNDRLIGGAGADKLDGGSNTDTASYSGASAGVVANLATASANTGDAKGDTYVSIENLTGSSHNDTLTGNTGINVLFGGAGADKMTGGTGADTFLFKAVGDTTVATTGRDTIFDFSHAQGDKISLSGIDANTALSGDQSFLFKGSAAFGGTKGELRFEKQASDTYVYGDTNGDKKADFVIHLDDAITFQASDFIF